MLMRWISLPRTVLSRLTASLASRGAFIDIKPLNPDFCAFLDAARVIQMPVAELGHPIGVWAFPGSAATVLAAEFVYASCSIDQSLLAGIERMAGGTDFDVQILAGS